MTALSKYEIFGYVRNLLRDKGIEIDHDDSTRPWGGFFVIKDSSLPLFIESFFPNTEIKPAFDNQPLSPKILLIEPGKRFSWQYHKRRSEIWTVAEGRAGLITSADDRQGEMTDFREGDIVRLECGTRHRLIGLDSWGIIAEIWQHTDPNNPSDEEDIVRIEDDFGR
ncbi:MAG: cupin domain-containing protein [Balneolaceae bacterium]|nr:MAG: cupin domain-containing protein [Balneolaceae bacterium]